MRNILIGICLLLMTGCATMWTVAQNPIVQAGVKSAIVSYMYDRPSKAQYAEELILELKAYADRQETFTVNDLETLSIDWIPWDRMSREDQGFVLDMIGIISDQLRSMVGDGLIAEDEKIKVKQFFDWILQAIRFAQE